MKKKNPRLICLGKAVVEVTLRALREKDSFKHFTATNLIGGKQPNCVDKHRLGLSRVIGGLWGK